MKRFLKRFFMFTLLVTVAGGGIGYYYGLRPDNYQEFFGDLKDRMLLDSDAEKGENVAEKSDENKSSNSTSKSSIPSAGNPYARIDRHARACPKSAEKDIATLAAYLEKGCKTDLEKARSIYVWLTKNVSYDDVSFNANQYGDCSATGVLASRKTVCSGYAALYEALGKEMGLEIKNVSGYAKGYGYVPGHKFTKVDHAWNVIKIEGQWRVFDATWGEGSGNSVNGKLKATKKFDDYWFNVDPYEAIFNHYPEDRALTLVSPDISLQVYEKFPYVHSTYFKMGFNGRKIYKTVRSKGYIEFPETFSHSGKIKVVDAPPFRDIQMGRPYLFRFYAPGVSKMALVDSKTGWTHLQKEAGYFFFEYTPKNTGELSVNIEKNANSGSWEGIIQYKVVRGKVNS